LTNEKAREAFKTLGIAVLIGSLCRIYCDREGTKVLVSVTQGSGTLYSLATLNVFHVDNIPL
jgi:hypothetical protein